MGNASPSIQTGPVSPQLFWGWLISLSEGLWNPVRLPSTGAVISHHLEGRREDRTVSGSTSLSAEETEQRPGVRFSDPIRLDLLSLGRVHSAEQGSWGQQLRDGDLQRKGAFGVPAQALCAQDRFIQTAAPGGAEPQTILFCPSTSLSIRG